MKFVKFLLVLAAIALVLFLTNPTLENHRSKVNLTAKITAEDVEKLKQAGVTRALPMIGTDAELPMLYQNYRLFSTTTDSYGGRLSLGLLGMVFDLRPAALRSKP